MSARDDQLTCAFCSEFLTQERREKGIPTCEKHDITWHTKRTCDHSWDKEVTGKNWSSKQCSKCDALAIDEAMAS